MGDKQPAHALSPARRASPACLAFNLPNASFSTSSRRKCGGRHFFVPAPCSLTLCAQGTSLKSPVRHGHCSIGRRNSRERTVGFGVPTLMDTERIAESRLARTHHGWSQRQRRAAFTLLLVAVAVGVPSAMRTAWGDIAAHAANVVWGDINILP